MPKSVEKAIADIAFQLGLLERLFHEYGGLLERTRQRAPDLVETTALGSVLHSFYNGLESIFLVVAKRVETWVPTAGVYCLAVRVLSPDPRRSRPGFVSV